MFRFARKRAPSEIAEVIEALVGPEEAARFWAAFREDYVTQADIRFIKAAGFNTVRVPLHWRLFVEPGAAEDGSADTFEGQGWTLLDRLVGWCRDAGLRVIVDLHAAPGGQTGVNHDDGTGFPLTFYVPRYRRAHGCDVESDRRALSRRARGARLRPSERADLALQRRGLSQSAARAALSRDRRRHPQRRCPSASCCSRADSGARALRCSAGRSMPTRFTPITNSGRSRRGTRCRAI